MFDAQRAFVEVDRDALLMGLAAVFAGMSMLLTVLAFTHSLFLLVVAVPFGATTYFLWYHASGRLAERVRRRRTSESGAEARHRARDAASGPGPGARFTAGAREARRGPSPGSGPGPGPGAGTRAGTGPRRGARAGPGGANRRGPNPAASTVGPSPAEAYRILGLDPGADDDAVRRAYREKVKEVHPDTDSGDEESFKRVNRAYERLTD